MNPVRVRQRSGSFGQRTEDRTIADAAPRIPTDDVSLGKGKAWSRTAVVAIGATAILLVVGWIWLGPPSSEGVGRVVGLNLFPYLITAGIATLRPRFRRWVPLIVLYVGVFVIILVLNTIGRMDDVAQVSAQLISA